MKRFASVAVLVGAMGYSVTSAAAISVVFASPAAGTVVRTSLSTDVTVTSDYTFTANAKVGAATYPLARITATTYRATIPLATVPDGAFTVDVTATDAFGDTATASRAFVNDAPAPPPPPPEPPTITFTSPGACTFMPRAGTVRVQASCAGGASPCTKIGIRGGVSVVGNSLATDVAVPEGATSICVDAETAAGGQAGSCRSVNVDPSPFLVPVATVPGCLSDATETALTYFLTGTATGPEYVRDRTTGVDTPLPLRLPNTYRYGGITSPLPTGATRVLAAGPTIAWTTGTSAAFDEVVHTRDVVTGAEHEVLVKVISGFGVSSNGDAIVGVWISGQVFSLHRFRGGVLTRLHNGLARFFDPSGDATVTVSNAGGDVAPNSFALLVMRSGGAPPFSEPKRFGKWKYTIGHGSVAYLKDSEVWVAPSDGRPGFSIAPWASGTTTLDAVDARGHTMHFRPDGRYEARTGLAPRRVSTTQGRSYSLGGFWHITMGNTLFRVSETPVLFPDPGDAGASDSGTGDDASTRDAGTGPAVGGAVTPPTVSPVADGVGGSSGEGSGSSCSSGATGRGSPGELSVGFVALALLAMRRQKRPVRAEPDRTESSRRSHPPCPTHARFLRGGGRARSGSSPFVPR